MKNTTGVDLRGAQVWEDAKGTRYVSSNCGLMIAVSKYMANSDSRFATIYQAIGQRLGKAN